MLVRAVLEEGLEVGPKPGLKALCPYCHTPVISKCGLCRRHHFAHLPGMRCVNAESEQVLAPAEASSWSEPETDWHLNWKAAFPPAWREVPLGSHQADIHTPRGLTIEFQHSPMTYAEVRERTAYYLKFGPMAWVVDAGALMKGLRFGPIPSDADRRHHNFFTAEGLPPGFNQMRDVWLDMEPLSAYVAPYVFLVTKWPGRYWPGKGFAISRQTFINCLLKQELPRPWLLHSPTA